MNWKPQYKPENIVLYTESSVTPMDRNRVVMASPEIKHHVVLPDHMQQYLSEELRHVSDPRERIKIIHSRMVELALFPYPVEYLD